MRSCDEMLELISAALDGELSDAEAEVLQEHLDHCAECRSLYAELSGVSQAMGELTVPAPEGFVDAVMDRIPPESQTPAGHVVSFPAKKRGYWRTWAASAAVAALVVLGAAQLPRLLGAGLDESASGANNGNALAGDASAPSGASNGAAAPEIAMADNDSADVNMDQPEEGVKNGCDSYNGGLESPEQDAGDNGAGDPSNGSSDSTDLEAAEGPGAAPTPAPAVSPAGPIYCGVLVLTGEPLPPGLEEFASARNSVGEMEYTVPAEYYFSNVAELEELSATNFRVIDAQEDRFVDPSAEFGLIIVQDDRE